MGIMNNFRAEDMPGGSKKADKQSEVKDEAPQVEVEETKVEEKKAPAPKKAPAKKAEPKEAPKDEAPVQTDTETHGVGPTDVDTVAPVGVQGDDNKNED